jgi:UDP-N-acetylmuramoylalanine--D-glutamate ligase
MTHARPPLPPGPYLVVGLARSGVAAALALAAARPGEQIVAVDSGCPPEALTAREGLERAGVEVHLESDGTHALEASPPPATLVKSPGVPQDAPVVARARREGLEVIGELELGWRLVPNEFIAVTGTNGKTTTVELIGAMHRAAGVPVAVAGNVGTPVSSIAGSLDPAATVVCEASSFQLEDTTAFAPEAAVLLNIAEDHLDRHGDVSHYRDAKLRIFANQDPADLAVVNAAIDVPSLTARTVTFGNEPVVDASDVRLRGEHNLLNATAAAVVCLARGIDPGDVRDALRSFTGIEHRMEHVAEVDGVEYVNDSKATNVIAAAAALRSFDGGVHAILGGSLKGGSFAELAPAIAERCRACYLIGEAAGQLAEDLAHTGVELVRCGDLERAEIEASQRARPGEVVLLAPACASFDQYRDYEERGEHFKELVHRLAGSR